MFALISYPAGVVTECLILGRQENRIRVVVPGLPDTIELEYRNSAWTSGSGEQFQLEFVSAIATQELPRQDVRTMAVGSFLA